MEKSFIPIYRAADPEAGDQHDQKKRKLSCKFISVAHNGETIYIRISTTFSRRREDFQ